MKILFLLIFISLPVFACKSKAPESIVKAMTLGQSVTGKDCSELPEEKCVCFDGIDVMDSDLIDGELIPNPDKKFARELKEKSEAEAAKAKEEKCKAFSFKGKTIAELRSELNESLECGK